MVLDRISQVICYCTLREPDLKLDAEGPCALEDLASMELLLSIPDLGHKHESSMIDSIPRTISLPRFEDLPCRSSLLRMRTRWLVECHSYTDSSDQRLGVFLDSMSIVLEFLSQ